MASKTATLPAIVAFNSCAAIADEVEFVTIMSLDSLDAARAFAGEDYEVAVVLPRARALLSNVDARSQHYAQQVTLSQPLNPTARR